MTAHTRRITRRTAGRAAAAGTITVALFALAPLAPLAHADAAGAPAPVAPPAAGIAAAHDAAAAPATLDTLSRFFARDGRVAFAKAQPRIAGTAVPVYTLSPDFVAGRTDAPVARLEFLASTAVSADGQKASVWTVKDGAAWKVVNIATGDDETRYAAEGAKKLDGGTVFREPQINAWYVQRGDRVLPLDSDAVRAVGADGTTVEAYRARVHKAYGDKLPGSAYAKKGLAGGYEEQAGTAGDAAAPAGGAAERTAGDELTASAARTDAGSPVNTASVAAAAGAAAALGASALVVRRKRRRG
ncbi:hypothetical protein [Streptomyces sp. UNOC14_S4]|uniref:hypothetical protein n=1 Tax=Streptomyces sp. UNOC14_S4 TaxID=2872340 RepID=UPI001E330CB3|nr:hypothetical protein [Streptomyces sp. UNOC14_S4]MCC3770474.1 hypothetical protein [Streptomyces sp. UNOC14_S4]